MFDSRQQNRADVYVIVLILDMQNVQTLFSKAHMQNLIQNDNYLLAVNQ